MNKNGKSEVNESRATLTRWAGLSAVAAGLCFVVVGLFHPVNVPESVTTAAWVNSHIAAVGLGFFGLFGLAGLYARQAHRAGWLGRIGYVLFTVWLALVMCFSFIEAFILPVLATESPAFVAGFLGMFTGLASEIDLGVLPTLWNVSGPMFILGPLLLAIATFRARILPRGAAMLQAVAALLVPVGGVVLSPEHEPLVMVPVGLALAWLGYALFAEQRAQAPAALPEHSTAASELSKVA